MAGTPYLQRGGTERANVARTAFLVNSVVLVAKGDVGCAVTTLSPPKGMYRLLNETVVLARCLPHSWLSETLECSLEGTSLSLSVCVQ